jgi:hypothetical protein
MITDRIKPREKILSNAQFRAYLLFWALLRAVPTACMWGFDSLRAKALGLFLLAMILLVGDVSDWRYLRLTPFTEAPNTLVRLVFWVIISVSFSLGLIGMLHG